MIYALLAVATSVSPSVEPRPEIDVPPSERVVQMTIQQRVILRVPRMAEPVPPPRRVRWKEKKGPRCIAMSALAGAAITRPESVDLYMRGGARLRAQLDDECPALDYYGGFYISPTRDGQICADRDTIHTRAGGKCGIDGFRTLVPDR